MTAPTPALMRALASLSPANKMLYSVEIDVAFNVAADEIARLNAKIDGAPHWQRCDTVLEGDGFDCTCWKEADA